MPPEAQEAWRAKSREQNRVHRAKYPEKLRERKRKYRAENAEKLRERKRKDYTENIAKIKEKNRKYYADHANQKNADQFFILTGAAESLTNLITQNKKTE